MKIQKRKEISDQVKQLTTLEDVEEGVKKNIDPKKAREFKLITREILQKLPNK